MSIFTGAGVAIVTPFNEDESVNYPKLKELVNFQIDNGIDSIIICGTTGESSTLTEQEHKDVIKACVEYTAGRVPVIAGTGSNSTATAIELSVDAVECGVDGLLIVTPYYNKATQEGLFQHYKAIAESVKGIPIVLYSVASRTGCNIEPATVARLAKEVENIVAIKEASGNISQVAKIMHLCGDSIDLYSGNDDQIVPLMSLGAKGVISVLANVAPQYTHDICATYLAGDVKKSCELQLNAIPLVDKLFCEVNPIPVKKAMNLMGLEVGNLRMPLTELSEANTIGMKKELEAFGLM
ncbi:MAG: 4-hydroxy-tetrahydrodipicolinate synthase [Eubacteriales bacterium]